MWKSHSQIEPSVVEPEGLTPVRLKPIIGMILTHFHPSPILMTYFPQTCFKIILPSLF
jgi:hypothetical protein